jgi:hypothetical protein
MRMKTSATRASPRAARPPWPTHCFEWLAPARPRRV